MADLDSLATKVIVKASNVELINAAYQQGNKIASDVDQEIGIDFLSEEDEAREHFLGECHETDEHQRQFTPAEFWINALNQRLDADEAWDIVESAMSTAFRDYFEKNWTKGLTVT